MLATNAGVHATLLSIRVAALKPLTFISYILWFENTDKSYRP